MPHTPFTGSAGPPVPMPASRITLALAGLGLGAGLALAACLAWPGIYFELSDRVRWRLGLDRMAQRQFEHTTTQVQLRGDPSIGPDATLLFGDSHLQGLPTSDLGTAATNFAIAGETAARLAQRIGRYASAQHARRIVLLAGTNDLSAGAAPSAAADAMADVMRQIPASTDIVLLALPPSVIGAALRGARDSLNLELIKRCADRPACQFVPLVTLARRDGSLQQAYAAADGVHLSGAGYGALAALVAQAIRQNQATPHPEHAAR